MTRSPSAGRLALRWVESPNIPALHKTCGLGSMTRISLRGTGATTFPGAGATAATGPTAAAGSNCDSIRFAKMLAGAPGSATRAAKKGSKRTAA